MSRARPVLPDRTYMVQRRCVQRQFLLNPSDDVNGAFLYVLARAVTETGVEVHAICVMANHFHLICTDPHEKLPEFMQRLDGLLARCLNVYYDRGENFFPSGTYSRIEPGDERALLERMVYVFANPVAAGLVAFGCEWPGVLTQPEDVGTREIVARKPRFFFSKRMPEEIRFRITTPPLIRSRRAEEGRPEEIAARYQEELRERLWQREREHRREREAAGKRFLGREAILAQSPFDSPDSLGRKAGAGRGGQGGGKVISRIACRDQWRRLELLLALDAWHAAYTQALESYCRGEREALFPAGTYKLRVQFGVRCAGPPT